MSPADVLGNLAAFAVQLAVIVTAARLLEAVLRVDDPRARLAYWQGVLLLSLVMPFVQPWHLAAPEEAAAMPDSARFAASPSVALAAEPMSAPPTVTLRTAPAPLPPAELPWPSIALACLGAGTAAALVRLALAARALRRARRRSRPLPDDAFGHTELRVSSEVASPVTFGWRRPVILLPEAFLGLGPEEQRSVICHETVHIERHHWLVQTCEEVLRTALWFHPAFHWLLGRLRLAREQAVDAEVVRRLGRRTPYLEALVSLATCGRASRLVPAATFFTRSHLSERVDLLLKEELMSRTRVLVSLASSAAAIALCAAGAIALAPFHASAESVVAPVPPVPPAAPAVVLPPMPPVPVVAEANVTEVPPAPPALPALPASVVLPPMPPVPVMAEVNVAEPPAPPAPARTKRSKTSPDDEMGQIHEERRHLEEARKALEIARRHLNEQAAQIGVEAAKMAAEMQSRMHEQTGRVHEQAQKAAEEARKAAEEQARAVHQQTAQIREQVLKQLEARERVSQGTMVEMEKRLRMMEEKLQQAHAELKAYKDKEAADEKKRD